MRLGAAITVFCLALSVHLNGQLTVDRPIKCGWSAHPELLRARIAMSQERPDRQVRYISASGAFAVNYDTSGQHAPDLVDDNGDGEPDWVVEVAAALDSARNLLLALGFDPAPADDDDIYDVYLQEYNGDTYGLTVPDGSDVHGRIVSYMLMDNDFAEDENYYTHGIDAARVTAAHEYFHAVQLGYGWRGGDLFFYEISSTWFEDVAFPEVNDWVYWFKEGSETFGKKPTQPMARTDGYSVAIFGHYLTHITGDYQPDIMRQTWARFKSASATVAIEYGLTSYSSNLTVAWTDFVARLFLNGRASPELYFYPDQDLLDAPDPGTPEILVDNLNLPFYNLRPGTAGIQSLEVEQTTNLYLKVRTAPATYAAKAVLCTQGYSLYQVSDNKWWSTGLAGDSEVVLVVGGELDSVVIDAQISDLQLALNRLFPNPISPGNYDKMTIEYIVAKNLIPGEHHLVIYDLLGREVFHRRLDQPEYGQILTLNLPFYTMKNWPSGVYFLQLTLGSAYSVSRAFTILK